MLETLRNAWKVEDLRKKLIFTLLMIVVFRLGAAIPVPFLDKQAIQAALEGTNLGIMDFLNMLTGQGFSNPSIFSMSIYPYITASIIIQLLTIAIPYLEELSKEGEEGKKKIARFTKIGAVFIAIVQAVATSQAFFKQGIVAQGTLENIVLIMTMVAGTMILVWIGELITERGVGNGISLIILIGIISGLPGLAISWTQQMLAGVLNPVKVILFAILAILITAWVVMIAEGQRKIPVQYAKRVVGRKMYGGQATHLPVKVNMAGVMPVIFASSLLSLPQILTLFISNEGATNFITKYLTLNGTAGVWIYSILQILLIILFAYFYTAIQFNTVEYAKNLQQQGGFIPGIRPGRSTGDYLQRVSNRITFIGAISLAILATLPLLLSLIFNLGVRFGGTSILIVVGVIIETVKQIEAQLMMRHYKGFLR